jgi:hypothetical protein
MKPDGGYFPFPDYFFKLNPDKSFSDVNLAPDVTTNPLKNCLPAAAQLASFRPRNWS